MVANPLANIRTLNDYMKAEEEFKLNKQAKQQEMELQKAKMQQLAAGGGENVPATIQITNELEKAIKAGDHDRANRLMQVHKTFDRGINPYAPVQQGGEVFPGMGQQVTPIFAPQAIQGYGSAVGSIAADKKGMETDAKNQSDLEYKPRIAGDVEQQKMNVELANAQDLSERKARGTANVAEQVSETKKDKARGQVSQNLLTLAKNYQNLNELGGAIDVNNSALENVSARIKSSAPGQLVGGAIGTDEQSMRNQIESIRPTLINDIRQASEMGAKGMDSEKELEFFLQAATDPKRDIQSNLAAISVLDGAYGLGAQVRADPEQIERLRQELTQTLERREPPKADPNNIPMDAAKELKNNPASAAQFDEIFGVGAAKMVLGK